MRDEFELAIAALDLHERLAAEGSDPADGVFVVTQEERLLLYSLPAFDLLMDERRQRLCGLRVKTIHPVPSNSIC